MHIGALIPTTAFAHDINTSFVRIFVTPDSLRVIYTFNLADLVNDLGVDLNGDDVVTRAELAVTLQKVYALVASRTSISADFTVLDLVPRRGGYTKDPSGDFFLVAFAQEHPREFRAVGVEELNTEDGLILVNAVLAAPLKRLPDVSLIGQDAAGNWGSAKFIDIVVEPTDNMAPLVTALSGPSSVSPGTANISVSGSATDATTGNSDIVAVEVFGDPDPGQGMGEPASATDGAFDSPTEAFQGTVNTFTWLSGSLHIVYARAKDTNGNWGMRPKSSLRRI